MAGAVAAYSAAGGTWQAGPGRVYDRLSEVVVSRSPVALAGSRVLDAGAGTGAATRAALAGGAAQVVAVDAAVGMLAHGAGGRPPATAGDLVALPFPAGSFDVSVAAFSLNHLPDPATGLRELARVTRSEGALVISAYAADDRHPVKAAVEVALARQGWVPEPWHVTLHDEITPLLATLDGCRAALRGAGLRGDVEHVRVPFPDLGPAELVGWRLGMAQHAPFVASLPPGPRRDVVDDAIRELGASPPPLVRSMMVITARKP